MSGQSRMRDWFTFSRGERYGLLVLCGLIVLTLTVKLRLPTWMSPQTVDTADLNKEVPLFRTIEKTYVEAPETVVEQAELLHDYFNFDPNTATAQQWRQLGLNERQIRNVSNYLAKGGRFRRKEDLKKLYTISAPLYNRLAPYIVIEHATNTKTEPISNAKTTHTLPQLEINTADSASLVELRGIGPVFASRILKYRQRLGGFAHTSQIGEIRGIDSTLVASLKTQLKTDSAQIRKITVNSASFKELVRHPYLNEQQTQGILHYRKLQKRVNSLDDLVRNHILTAHEAEILRPYLSFE